MTWPIHRPDREADAISDYWDTLVRQQPALPVPPPDVPADQAAVLRQLHAEEEFASQPPYQGELLSSLLATYGETMSMTSTTAVGLSQSPSGPNNSAPPHLRNRHAISEVLAPQSAASTGHVPVSAGWRGRSTRSRLDRFATGAMALVLIVAIGGGAWLIADRNPFDGGDDPPSNTRSGAVPEVTIEPGTSMSIIPYPDADCKVKRPSRSWVVEHLKQGRGGYVVPSTLYEVPIRPTEGERTAMLETFSLWLSCQVSGAPFAYSFGMETPQYTCKRGFVSWYSQGRPDDEEVQRLASIAFSRPDRGTDESGLDHSVATPVDVSGSYNALPIPPGATPVTNPNELMGVGFWPVIFGDEIQVVSPGRAKAWVYSVNPETMEIQIAGTQNLVVEFQLMDGQWLIDRYGPAGTG